MQLHSALTDDEYTEIPGVLVNGWSGSWKKYLFSLMYHNDWYLLYPGYKQVSLLVTLSFRCTVSCRFGIGTSNLECWKMPESSEGFLGIWKGVLAKSYGCFLGESTESFCVSRPEIQSGRYYRLKRTLGKQQELSGGEGGGRVASS